MKAATILEIEEPNGDSRTLRPRLPVKSAVSLTEPRRYAFQLSRAGISAGGGFVFAQSAESAQQTAELTLAGGADVHVIDSAGQPPADQVLAT